MFQNENDYIVMITRKSSPGVIMIGSNIVVAVLTFTGLSDMVGSLPLWIRIGNRYAGPGKFSKGREAGPEIRHIEFPDGLDPNFIISREQISGNR